MNPSLRIFLVLACLTPFGCSFHRSASPEDIELRSRQHAAEAAVSALHDSVHAPRPEITVASQEDVTWNDSCLGCPNAGESCSQVQTPGYRVSLRIRDATYEYHTDRGGHVRICNQGQVLSPPPPGH